MSANHQKRGAWQPVLFLCLVLALLASQVSCSGFPGLIGAEPVTLRFVFFQGIADYTSLVETYQRKHPNVTIELIPINISGNPSRDLENEMEKADAIRFPVEAVSLEIAKSYLPLDQFISTDRNFPQEKIFPGVLDGLKFDGKQVGLPAGLNPYVVYYSQSKFKLAGMEPPAPGWSLEDFVLTATSLHDITQPGDPRYMYGFCSVPEGPDPAILMYMFGGGILDNLYQPTRPTLDRPENIEALSWYASLKTDLGIIPELGSPNEYYRLRSRLACGFWMDWMDRAVYMQLSEDESAMLPLPSYRAPFGVVNLDGYFITSQSTHPNETYDWLRFLMEQEGASGQLIPPLTSQIESAEYSARVSPAIAAIAKNLNAQTVVMGLEMYRQERFGQVLGLLNQAAVAVMDGQVDAATALTGAQQKAEGAFR